MDKEVNIKIVKTMHNKDLIQRVNFLQQASILIASKNTNLSSYYGSLFKKIQKKGQLRVDSSIKRNFCARCSVSLAHASNVTAFDDNFMSIECTKCHYVKKYPINDRKEPQINDPEITKEILICDSMSSTS